MGGGGSKKKAAKFDPPAPRIPTPIPEVKPEYSSPVQSPHLPAVSSRQPSVHSRVPSMDTQASSAHNQASALKSRSPSVHIRTSPLQNQASALKSRSPSSNSQLSNKQQGVTNLPNGNNRHTPLGDRKNSSRRESGDAALPPIDNLHNRSQTRSSSGSSTVTPPPLPVIEPRTNSSASSEFHKHAHRKHSTTSHGQVNHCSHCPHCQRMNKLQSTSSPKPKWLTERPGNEQVRIMMDEYDVEAVKKKILADNGHIPGSYDYRPQLIMEQVDDYDITKENYFTQPVIAKTKPRVLATSTPFPEYDFLQRREQRLNKPHTLSLFID